MGLDISTVKNAKLVKGVESLSDLTDDDYESGHIVYGSDFPEHLDGLTPGVYSGDPGIAFRAGSYGGYNAWREQLSEFALGVTPEVVWNTTSYHDKPFASLIHFSDCEGTIGPITAKSLSEDFEKYREGARAHLDDYSFSKYEDFATAFKEAASTNGFVIFH